MSLLCNGASLADVIMIRRPPTSITLQQSEVEELKSERINSHLQQPLYEYREEEKGKAIGGAAPEEDQSEEQEQSIEEAQ